MTTLNSLKQVRTHPEIEAARGQGDQQKNLHTEKVWAALQLQLDFSGRLWL